MKMTDFDFRALERQAEENGEQLYQQTGAEIQCLLPQQLGEVGDRRPAGRPSI